LSVGTPKDRLEAYATLQRDVARRSISILLVILEGRCLQRSGSRKRLPSNKRDIAQHGAAKGPGGAPSQFTLRTHNKWTGKIHRLGEPLLGAQFNQPVALHLG